MQRLLSVSHGLITGFWSNEGVYRVSGSKPRIQKLCQAFETQKEQVDLSDLSPHDITSILKHFFKEVQEALLNESPNWIDWLHQ